MASIYMRLTPTGKRDLRLDPRFSSRSGWRRPPTGNAGRTSSPPIPLPTLPEKAVRPGDSWQTRFQDGKINMEKLYAQTSVVQGTLARGEFVGVEWEMGPPVRQAPQFHRRRSA